MIEEIKKRLENGERVFLKCINKEEFISKNKLNREILDLKETEVQCYQEEDCDNFGGLQLKGFNIDYMFIRDNEIEYFEIVKNKPTFDDLIDVAVKAYKDGVLKSLKLLDYGVHSLSYSVDADVNGDENTIFSQHEDYSDGIDFINSLYTETFVIEREDDIKKVFIDKETKIELANGVLCTVNSRTNCSGRGSLLYVCNSQTNRKDQLAFTALKGATVTQKRGE